jgi:hypothetical protein
MGIGDPDTNRPGATLARARGPPLPEAAMACARDPWRCGMLRKLLVTTGLVVALLTTQAGAALADVTEVNATITSATLIDPAHVLVEGTVTCDAPATADMFLVLRQRGGVAGFREGFGFATVSCGTTPTTFSTVVTGGPFHRGSALLDVFVFAFDEFGQFVEDRLITTVRIT